MNDHDTGEKPDGRAIPLTSYEPGTLGKKLEVRELVDADKVRLRTINADGLAAASIVVLKGDLREALFVESDAE